MKNGKASSAAGRIDVAFVRKSTQAQDDQGQMDNVRTMLRELGVSVPDSHWYVGTVSRRKVKSNERFNELMVLVESDKIGTVYVESQDRWGTSDRVELFSLLGTLREHGTRLYDLRARKDLTEKDFATEMLAILGSFKSEKELQDTAYRSLRTRLSIFNDLGSWPTGTHPYGYGKRCLSTDGKLLWEWHPSRRKSGGGHLYYPAADGSLLPGPDDVAIPRKAKGQRERTVLVPNRKHPEYVEAVKLVFDLFVRVGLSRRAISARLNQAGHRFNGGPFTHPDITNILDNPAYVGDTHFGKRQLGDLQTFDDKGIVVAASGKGKRTEGHRLIKPNTHEGLIDRPTWELAQKKLTAERRRTSHAPRNPAYYLKQLFVCGHCGKGLTGRTETDSKTGKKKVIYLCSTYVGGRCGGHEVECGYQRITHEAAERLLLDKAKELNLEQESMTSGAARLNLQDRLARLGHEDEQSNQQWKKAFEDGLDAFADYLSEEYPEMDWRELQKMRKQAWRFYCSERLEDLRNDIQKAEQRAVQAARSKLSELRSEHTSLTKSWARATEAMQAVLLDEIKRLELEIGAWEGRTVPMTERLKSVYSAESERQAERERLLAEWPALESREKGEAMRRLFTQVTLFWEKKWHPTPERPSRKRATNRSGRFGYTLRSDRTQWEYTELDSASFR
jgi:hypothetical protein